MCEMDQSIESARYRNVLLLWAKLYREKIDIFSPTQFEFEYSFGRNKTVLHRFNLHS